MTTPGQTMFLTSDGLQYLTITIAKIMHGDYSQKDSAVLDRGACVNVTEDLEPCG